MILHELEISGYRGFSLAEKIVFAVPDGKLGSGLTVIVGPNNSGKSTVMEALGYLRSFQRGFVFTSEQRNAASRGEVNIRYATDGGPCRLVSGAGGAAVWLDKGADAAGKVLVIPSRRGIEQGFQLSGNSRPHYIEQSPDFATRTQYANNFGERLSEIERDEASRNRFIQLLAKVLPDPPRWYLDSNPQGNHFMKVTSGTSPHHSDGLGQGVVAAMLIVGALYDSSPGEVIAVDEPEVSLQPAVQRRLAAVLADYASTRQIVLATHSPYFVPVEYLENGATVARVSLDRGRSRIGQLQRSTVEKLSRLLGDKNNPHSLGLDACEVFFLENDVILVEGQEDVVGYRSVFKQVEREPRASFYGWGVGGSSKMPVIASVLHDLKFTRVAGILDAGKEADAKQLRTAFPEYKFFVTDTSDVRDKKAQRARDARPGLLDEEGKIHAEHLNRTAALVNSVADYFDSGAAS